MGEGFHAKPAVGFKKGRFGGDFVGNQHGEHPVPQFDDDPDKRIPTLEVGVLEGVFDEIDGNHRRQNF